MTTTELARAHALVGLCSQRCNRPARPGRVMCEECAAKKSKQDADRRGGYKWSPGSIGRPPIFNADERRSSL